MSQKNRLTEAFTKMASNYEESVDAEIRGFWGWRYEDFIDILLKDTSIRNGDIVLDVATGTGVIPERLVKAGLTKNPIHGLDITMEMLKYAKRRSSGNGHQDQIACVCANAVQMPYKNESFTLVICGLATHHMSVPQLLQENFRILQQGGRLSIADAGGAPSWRIPGAKLLLKLAAFIYFSLSKKISRAWIEAGAVSNVRTREGWCTLLEETGFRDISVVALKSNHAWISAPLCIRAVKSGGESI